MRVITGDLIELAKNGEFDVILHGCNCFCTMGAGIAKQIKDNFPEAYFADLETGKGLAKLGSVSFADVIPMSNKLRVVNAYTQYHMGANFNEVALMRCLRWVAENCQGKRIGYPRIGCGIGGGDWNFVSSLINKELKGMDHTLVEYEGLHVN